VLKGEKGSRGAIKKRSCADLPRKRRACADLQRATQTSLDPPPRKAYRTGFVTSLKKGSLPEEGKGGGFSLAESGHCLLSKRQCNLPKRGGRGKRTAQCRQLQKGRLDPLRRKGANLARRGRGGGKGAGLDLQIEAVWRVFVVGGEGKRKGPSILSRENNVRAPKGRPRGRGGRKMGI